MFFDSWADILRTLIIGPLAYGALVLMLRISGKRTLAKMNAFDMVVTVALGSTLATILLSSDVALAEGVIGLLVLIGLQFIVAYAAVRLAPVLELVKSTPRVLLRDGEIDASALVDERASREEVLAAIRASGIGDVSQVAAVVLETDGSFSVISRAQAGDGSALQTARGAE